MDMLSKGEMVTFDMIEEWYDFNSEFSNWRN